MLTFCLSCIKMNADQTGGFCDTEKGITTESADNYPKTILTLDRFSQGNYNGVQVVNVVDWLLGQAI